MSYKNEQPTALAVALNNVPKESFDIDPTIIEQTAQYHRKQTVENKANPVVRRIPMDRITRANIADQEEFKQRRESKEDAERRWKELFND